MRTLTFLLSLMGFGAQALAAGDVHPLDYKLAVADALAGLLAPLAEHFAATPDLLDAVTVITGD